MERFGQVYVYYTDRDPNCFASFCTDQTEFRGTP
ncbi:hypothetical protein [Salinibacter virus M31CR41-3]|nr:hypothetical protein [Salinibacter virus M31CR41-3]